jgi:hypothetical protein
MIRRALLISLFVILAACSATVPVETQTVDGLQVIFTSPDNQSVNRAVDFTVDIFDAVGRPINDAAVYLDMDMPAMPMGVTRPVAESRGNGRYTAMTAYTMAGLWEITVVIERPDGSTSRVLFTRTVRAEE